MKNVVAHIVDFGTFIIPDKTLNRINATEKSMDQWTEIQEC